MQDVGTASFCIAVLGMFTPESPFALLHHSFGPYHLARARLLAQRFQGSVRFVQLARSESLREWRADAADFTIETAVEGVLDVAPASEVSAGLERILARLNPRSIAISGYAHPALRRAATWARRRGVKTILISDSQARDWPRRWWREKLKRRWVSRQFDAAFVSGGSAAFYAESLGIPAHRIWRGYDVVDNQYFSQQAEVARRDAERLRREWGLSRHYFLYVGRLSPEKNLPRLIDAFRAAFPQLPSEDWTLALVGSGPVEQALRTQARSLGDRVRFFGFQQLDRLPSFYGLADALVLPSLSEPWGLVVNEAMAAGLPAIVSSQCGCGMELVFPGVNGFIIDPSTTGSLTDALIALASDADLRRRYGEASTRIIQTFSLESWSDALSDAALALAR